MPADLQRALATALEETAMKQGNVLGFGLLLTVAAFGLEPAPPAAAASVFDGNYRGTFDLSASGLSQQNEFRSKCVERRLAVMVVRDGFATIEYANWNGHRLHYRGNVAADGALTMYHTNSDGSRAMLTGRIGNNVLTGNMMREGCAYTVNLTRS